jgi:hypothetical protein
MRRRNYQHFQLDTDLCHATLTVDERRVRGDKLRHDDTTNGESISEKVLQLKMLFQSASEPAAIVVRLQQVSYAWELLYPAPSLVVGNVRPDDAMVFSTVLNGDVEYLQTMITEGEANLRDRDSQGRPLLHVGFTIRRNEFCTD